MTSNCFCFEPGVVLSLERAYWQPSKSDVGLSPAGETAFYPSSSIALRRYYTTPGDELNVLAHLGNRNEVIAASLNYLGTEAAKRTVEDAVPLDQLKNARWFHGEMRSGSPVFDGNRCTLSDREFEPNLPVVIDGAEDHARRVVYQLRKSYQDVAKKAMDGPLTLALITPLLLTTDLFAYCLLLLAAAELKSRISVVNLSVDLGTLCHGLGAAGMPMPAEFFSFPFFEDCLNIFLASRAKLRHDHPVIAAAAGNIRADKVRRWRLAYPASLPYVAAVTCTAKDTTLIPAVDWPAVGPLKPCFASTSAEFPKTDFRSHLTDQTTSYACATFSGWVAAIDEQLSWRALGSFGKLASLAALSNATRIREPGPTCWAPVDLQYPRALQYAHDGGADGRQIQRDRRAFRSAQNSGEIGFFRGMLQMLLDKTGREYVLTGSAAFVERYLETRPALRAGGKFLDLIGDFDMFYTGLDHDTEQAVEMDQNIRGWLTTKSETDARPWPGEVIAHPIRNWPGALYLYQCVVPEIHVLATSGGVIDPWATCERADGLPPLYIPPLKIWLQNPQLLGGESGLADGIMAYINRLTLEVRLSRLVKEESDLPEWIGIDILDALQVKIDQQVGTDPSDDIWFGRGCSGPALRLKYRLTRIERMIAPLKEDDRYESFLRSVRRILQVSGKLSLARKSNVLT